MCSHYRDKFYIAYNNIKILFNNIFSNFVKITFARISKRNEINDDKTNGRYTGFGFILQRISKTILQVIECDSSVVLSKIDFLL